MRTRLPGAVQLVHDNYNALVIGFGPSERTFAPMPEAVTRELDRVFLGE